MRILRIVLSLLITAWVFPLKAQEAPKRDPVAITVLQQSFAAMGGRVPIDSVATGTVELTEGPSVSTGNVRILTRGTDQTLEEMQLSGALRKMVYSRGVAASDQGSGQNAKSLEWASTAQSAKAPANLIAAALASSDSAFEDLGLEDLEKGKFHRIRFWNTFASNPKLARLAPFTTREIWIDAATGLPFKLSYEAREGAGAVPRIPMEVFYSDYRPIGGILIPFRIEENLNGTPWAVVVIQRVEIGTGLTDAHFQVSRRRP